jgi:lipopolysaccharide export LptBFGC system permease protein LptF
VKILDKYLKTFLITFTTVFVILFLYSFFKQFGYLLRSYGKDLDFFYDYKVSLFSMPINSLSSIIDFIIS